MKPKEIVERGYDEVAQFYHDKRMQGFWSNESEIGEFWRRLPKEGAVLDAGCGTGYVSALLENLGFKVTGIDISKKMTELARKSAPQSKFIRMDMTDMKFPQRAFDGVMCLYAIIHVPRRSHAPVLRSFWRVMKPGGILAIHMGWGDHVGTEDDWLGSGAPMYWSHYGRGKNIALIRRAKFDIILSRASKQRDSTHLFVLAQKA